MNTKQLVQRLWYVFSAYILCQCLFIWMIIKYVFCDNKQPCVEKFISGKTPFGNGKIIRSDTNIASARIKCISSVYCLTPLDVFSLFNKKNSDSSFYAKYPQIIFHKYEYMSIFVNH